MNIEHTLSIIKPNIITKNIIGKIISRLEKNNFHIIGIKMLQLSQEQAKYFYTEHKQKHFFNDLINFMTSSPIVVQVLESEHAIIRYRKIIGSTNPNHALIGTIRADYSDGYIENAVHGSDSTESAIREIAYFFNKNEIYTRIN